MWPYDFYRTFNISPTTPNQEASELCIFYWTKTMNWMNCAGGGFWVLWGGGVCKRGAGFAFTGCWFGHWTAGPMVFVVSGWSSNDKRLLWQWRSTTYSHKRSQYVVTGTTRVPIINGNWKTYFIWMCIHSVPRHTQDKELTIASKWRVIIIIITLLLLL